ncbi:hypothetical protein [Paraburkholderia oxyphila]|uniref:hypothetical protein n=1 Tax=Paraburkholderia oxyphila TaxID=614212 RepID=UPI0012EDA51D|nr:hypothetical protein [Paraburkholderia oxyphila]
MFVSSFLIVVWILVFNSIAQAAGQQQLPCPGRRRGQAGVSVERSVDFPRLLFGINSLRMTGIFFIAFHLRAELGECRHSHAGRLARGSKPMGFFM